MSYKKGKAVKLSTNFKSTEFDCHGSGCCSYTDIDIKLVEYLQKIRTHFGKSITITSGYRCEKHNKRVGGSTNSYHRKGQAADIVVSGVAPSEVAKYAESIGVLGIGLYETNSDGYFVHIDTRTKKAFWYGQKQLYRSTFGGKPVSNKVKITASVLNVRAGAGTNYSVITTVRNGTVHNLLEEKNGWGRISSGWINSKYYKKM